MIRPSLSSQHGFTLVELMVALVVGLLVMFGVGQIFVQGKRSASVQDEAGRLQEGARYALQLMKRDIQRAGYLGCSHAATLKENIVTGGSYVDDLEHFVAGHEGLQGSWDPPLPTELDDPGTADDDVAPGTDVITLRFSDGEGLRMTQPKQPYHFRVHNLSVESGACPDGASSYSGLCVGDLVVVSDCTKARTATVESLHLSGGDLSIYHTNPSWGDSADMDPRNHFNPAHSYIFKGVTVSYFVHPQDGGGGAPALYRKVGNGGAEALVDGVEDMQIRYGVDDDGDGIPNRFLTADNVADFRQVVAVRIALLLRSIEERLRKPKARTFHLLKKTVTTPADRYLRKVFDTTVQLRNG